MSDSYKIWLPSDIFFGLCCGASLCAFMHVLAEMTTETESVDWLLELLRDVQLEQFYVKLRDNLQVTRQVATYCVTYSLVLLLVYFMASVWGFSF